MGLKINNKNIDAIRVGEYKRFNFNGNKPPKNLKNNYYPTWYLNKGMLLENRAYRIVVFDSKEGNYSPEGLALYFMSDSSRYHNLKPLGSSTDWYIDFVAQGEKIDVDQLCIINNSGKDKENLSFQFYIYEQPSQIYKVYKGRRLIMDRYMMQEKFKDRTFEYNKENAIKGSDGMLIKDRWYQLIFEDDGSSKDIGAIFLKNTDNAGYLYFRKLGDSNRWYINFLYDGLVADNGSITLINKNSGLSPSLSGTLSLYKDLRSRSPVK